MNLRTIRPAALLLLSGLALAACGKQTFVASVFVKTPTLTVPIDPSQPAVMATIPSFAILETYLGTIDTTDPTKIDASKEAPVTGAAATLSWHSITPGLGTAGQDVVLKDIKEGTPGLYSLDSSSESKLAFEPRAPYTLVLEAPDGEAYGARLTPGDPAAIQEFTANRLVDAGNNSIGNAYTIHRTDGSAGNYSPAFVLVFQIDPNNPAKVPNLSDTSTFYSSLPLKVNDILKYALSDAPYRIGTFTIPGSAFPQAGYYVVALLATQPGKVSNNAFIGSIALAGNGDAGVLHVHN